MLASISRLATEICPPETLAAASELRQLMAAYRDKEDLIAIGAYQPGADPVVDTAIALRGELDTFLRQRVDEPSDIATADQRLQELAAAARGAAPADEGPDAPAAPDGAPADVYPLNVQLPQLD